MKKTYINPTLKVVKAKGARLLAGSLQLKDVNAGKSMGRSARFSDWSEDEEE